MKSIIYVGLDVHQETVTLAYVAPGARAASEPVTLPNDPAKIRRALQRMAQAGSDLKVCYEAGGCGYVLQRHIESWGHVCEVIAPSLIPKRSGDRRKTDRRDAVKLALLYRAGELTPIHIPDAAQEAVRGLVRCREAYTREILSSRHYITKLLLARGYVFREGRNWSLKYWSWLRNLKLATVDQRVLDSYLHLLEFKLQERAALDKEIEAIAFTEPYEKLVRRLRVLRGFGTLTAMTLITEIHDFRRFGTPRELMAYLGMVPSEYSSGGKERRGNITKTGNARCRRVLVEAAWHYTKPPRMGKLLKQRQEGQPPEATAHSWKAQQRLHRRYRCLVARKNPKVAITAVARELIGFVWALALTPDQVA